MTLRWRLSLALAALAAAASIASTGVAYGTTDSRISAGVDAAIEQAASQIVTRSGAPASAAAPAGTAGPGGASGPAARSAPAGASVPVPPPGASGVPGSPGTTGRPMPAGAGAPLLASVVVQHLSAQGAIQSTQAGESSVTLPVASRDREIASAAGPPWLRTEDVDGTPYRVITASMPDGGAVQVAQSLDQTDAALASLRWRLILLALAVTVVGAFAGWLVAGRITAPLEELTDAAEDVAAHGALERPIATAGDDEVGRLGRSFATMLAALARSRQQQHSLVHDAGHELRTPLTSLRSNIDLLRRHGDGLSPEASARILADLDSELRELSSLVDEVVGLATDTQVAEPTARLHVDELVARVVDRARARLGREIAVSAAPWCVDGRVHSIERALANLLGNAAKFSPDGTPIHVDAEPGRILVRDLGPGLAAEDIPRVFDRFYRSEAARSMPGSGLGLAIVRQVAETHGGSVVAGNAPGGGACIGMLLPIARTAPAGAVPADDRSATAPPGAAGREA